MLSEQQDTICLMLLYKGINSYVYGVCTSVLTQSVLVYINLIKTTEVNSAILLVKLIMKLGVLAIS